MFDAVRERFASLINVLRSRPAPEAAQLKAAHKQLEAAMAGKGDKATCLAAVKELALASPAAQCWFTTAGTTRMACLIAGGGERKAAAAALETLAALCMGCEQAVRRAVDCSIVLTVLRHLGLHHDFKLATAALHVLQTLAAMPGSLDAAQQTAVARQLLSLLAAATPTQSPGPQASPPSPPQATKTSRAAVREAAAPTVPPDQALLLKETLNALWVVASSSLGREAGRRLQMQGLAMPALVAVLSQCMAGGALQHQHDILEACLGACAVLTADANFNAQQMAAAHGVPLLLAVLADASVPCDARSQACLCLAHLCSRPSSCDAVVRAHGPALLVRLIRTQAPDASRPEVEAVLEELIQILACLAADRIHYSVVADAAVLKLLLGILKGSLTSGLSYRPATAVAEVLRALAAHSGATGVLAAALPPAQARELPALLLGFIDRVADSEPDAESIEHAMAACGAWCACSVLCALISAPPGQATAAGLQLPGSGAGSARSLCRLLVTTMQSQLCAWEGVGSATSPAGAYLRSRRVQASMQTGLLALLGQLAQLVGAARPGSPGGAALPMQQQVAACLSRMVAWPQAGWHAKRVLHLLGLMDSEYCPFVRYSQAQLQAVLQQQGIPPRLLLDRGVDAHLLLDLTEAFMRSSLFIDDITLLKIRRLQAAHAMFTAADAQDGKVDGIVSPADLQAYLTDERQLRPSVAESLVQRVSADLGLQEPAVEGMAAPMTVHAGGAPGGEGSSAAGGDGAASITATAQPLSFAHFLRVYPWLSSELEAMVQPGGGKRQRLA